MKFMDEQGEIVEGTPVSDVKLEALEFLQEGLENESYEHLGIMFIESQKIKSILQFVAKNFNIERIPQPELVKAEIAQLGTAEQESVDEITF